MKIFFTTLLMFFASNTLANGSYVDKWQWNNGPECAVYFNPSDEPMVKEYWDGNGEPPISISDARKLVLNWVKEEYQGEISPSMVSYNLTSYHAKGMKTNHWLYNIRYVKFRNGIPDKDFNENIVVLMDGAILSKQCNQ